MNILPVPSVRSRAAGFTAVELVVAVILFSAAASGALVLGKAMRDHRMAAISANQQNAYATFQSQVALQGINPALVSNPAAGAINRGIRAESAITAGANLSASFESRAVAQPEGAARTLAGSARVDAITYTLPSAGNQATRGTGIGFAIETAGPAPAAGPNAIPLSPPIFNLSGDLTNADFPLNDIATLPGTNPPGTVYRYTTDGSDPTGSSPVWDNDPGWTPATFPAQLTLRAFNPDPQYSASATVTAQYSMNLAMGYARADSRAANLYGFSLAELSSPGATGIVLTPSVDGYAIVLTLDGSDPSSSPTSSTYSGPFAPDPSQFSPSATLKAYARSNDPRIASSPVQTYFLTTVQVAMPAPSFVTPNGQPLDPGTVVVLSVPGSGTSRTEINNGVPTQASSQANSFPLN